MNKETIPQPIGRFVRTVNEGDAEAFLATFSNDAVVTDVGRELRCDQRLGEERDLRC